MDKMDVCLVSDGIPRPFVEFPDSNIITGLAIETAGLGKEHLGADEAECILIGMVSVDVVDLKVLKKSSYFVQPQKNNVNFETVKERGFTEEQLNNAKPLQDVLVEIEQASAGEPLVFATDGPLLLRQSLHPEALKKGIGLPIPYWSYFDIRKEFCRIYHNNNEQVASLDDILTYLGQEPKVAAEGATPDPYAEMDKQLNEVASVLMTLTQGAKDRGVKAFAEPESIKSFLEHGICARSDSVDNSLVVRARGLPWQASDHDVAKFFIGLNIAKGGVALCLSEHGRRNGEALVRFETAEHRDMALRRHRHFMGNRYIEVYRATGTDFVAIASGYSDEAERFLTRGAAVIVRMRGLPYDCTAQEIIHFFKNSDVETERVDVMDNEEGILFVNRADGRATGDAFVLFEKEADATRALAKHKEVIRTRYIELFRSTTAEVQQVINRSLEVQQTNQRTEQQTNQSLVTSFPAGMQVALNMLASQQQAQAAAQQALFAANLPLSIPTLPPASLPFSPPAQSPVTNNNVMPQPLVISGSTRDCIRLRGLPYEAQVQHILEFLAEYSKHIAFQGVHMVYNSQGHPSGEAFIQMTSEQAAASAANDRHNNYMQIGRKQRYIEVFQCSADDMNLVLTGPTTPQTTQLTSPLFTPQEHMADAAAALTPMSPHRPQVLSPFASPGFLPQMPISPASPQQFTAQQLFNTAGWPQPQIPFSAAYTTCLPAAFLTSPPALHHLGGMTTPDLLVRSGQLGQSPVKPHMIGQGRIA